MHVQGPLLRGDEGPGGSLPATRDRGGEKRDGRVVRTGPVDMPGGPGVLGGRELLPAVLQAHAAGRVVLGTVSELGGDTSASGEGAQDEPVPVHRQDDGRVSAQQGAHGEAVLRGGQRSASDRRQQVQEELEEAQAKDVRTGPRSGRDRNDDRQRGLRAGGLARQV